MQLACVGLIALTAAFCLSFARLDGDAAVYALLAKQMVLSGDWLKLYFQGAEWLDKPHFPFWAVAASFSIFGLNEQAYLLPGLLFYALGAWFTYLLARELFDRSVASLACLLYASTLGLLLAASDQKAEVYLLALMTGASYAWLRFARQTAWRWWLLGSVLTGCALMTKGVFVLLLIGVGPVAQAMAQRDWRGLLHPKWLAAVLGSALFTVPELVALYGQFGTPGWKFFFWDSQFGRFFNTGPIKNEGGTPYFYFHNLLWTALPWSVLLVRTVWTTLGRAPALWGARREDAHGALAFVWASFGAAFVLFSATRFQMDYYLNIVMSYLLIACAQAWVHWRGGAAKTARGSWQQAQEILAIAVFCAAAALFALDSEDDFWAWGAAGICIAVMALVWLRKRGSSDVWTRTLAWTIAAIFSLFAFVQLNHFELYQRHEVGRQIAHAMVGKPVYPVFVYGRAMKNLDFFGAVPALPVYDMAPVADGLRAASGRQGVYVVIAQAQAPARLGELQSLLNRPGDKLRVNQIQDFQEARLPPQFVRRLTTPDAELPRQTLLLLHLSLPI
jgi:4-amino-4-deoxy-L-arabinose transferase-like glycosyltransferase